MMFSLSQPEEDGEIRPLCPLPLLLKDGQWEDWVPPANHVVRPIYEQLEIYFLGGLYTQQKELLGELYEIQLFDVFVASFSTVKNPETQALRSFCIWPNGVDSLLPKTQLVMIMDDPDSPPNIVEWKEVQRVVGHMMEPDDNYPTRYRVTEYPTESQIAEMVKVEL